MSDIKLIQKSDLNSGHFDNDNTNGKGGIKMKVSSDSGNMLQMRDNGVYYGVEAPKDTRFMHVANEGDDSNDGTRDNPLATIREAFRRNGKNQRFDIRLKEGQVHEWRSSWGDMQGKSAYIVGYGDSYDAAAADNPIGSIQYIRSNQLNRPTLKLIADRIASPITKQITATLHSSVDVSTLSFVGINVVGSLPEYQAVINAGNKEVAENIGYGAGFLGNPYASHNVQFVGCHLRNETTIPFLICNGSINLLLDACSVDKTDGATTKLFYSYRVSDNVVSVQNAGMPGNRVFAGLNRNGQPTSLIGKESLPMGEWRNYFHGSFIKQDTNTVATNGLF